MSLPGRLASLAQRDALTTVGLAVSAVWLILLLLFWLLAPGGDGAAGGISRLITIIGAVMPLALIWMAVALARAIAVLRAEAADLQLRLSQLREMAATRGRPPAPTSAAAPTITEPQPEPAMPAPERRQDSPPPRPTQPATPPARPRPAADLRQQAMRFDAPEPVEIPADTLIRALNFPDGADDHQGIAALRMALTDHDSARVLRAAQDVVTLLAGQDIYMDNLPPDPAPVAVWRRFADGARGSAVSALGGIHDQTALQITSDLLRTDEIFRDATHHFLRHFDLMLTRSLSGLDDAQVAMLADTRSARAFMLTGRAAGIFG